jgi:flagellar basal-body rod protein FlgG
MSATDAARTGMIFQQRNVETIANNLANANTAGFKRSAVRFGDLLTHVRDLFDVADGAAGNLADSEGVLLTGTDRYMLQGSIQPTERPTDFAIAGEGFFAITLNDGSTAYTRDGSFRVDGEGRLVTAQGFVVQPGITVPAGTAFIEVAADGTLTATNAASETQAIGQLQLALFTNPAGLSSIGHNLLAPSENSGEAVLGAPSEGGRGVVGSGALEASNVDVGQEMTALIVAQRSYQMSLSAYQTASEMDRLARELAVRF